MRTVGSGTIAETPGDAALLTRFIEGEDNAFLTLFRRYNQRLFVYCLKVTGEQSQAEDITQEMWERVIGLRRNPQDVRNPGGFFLRIARNLCIDYLRSRRPQVSLDEVQNIDALMSTQRAPSELEDLALTMLDRLPFEHREVLVLNLYCGYRFDEIAAMMGKTPDAIWACASRARAQLRRWVAAAMAPAADRTDDARTRRDARKTEGP